MTIIASHVVNLPTLPAATPGTSVSAASPSGAEQRGEIGRLVNFAGLADMVVVGNASQPAIGQMESYLRTLNSAPESSSDLRQLRQHTEQSGVYPVLAFEDTVGGMQATLHRARTARPGEHVDLQTPADSPAPGGSGEAPEIMDLIGRLAGNLAQLQREQGAHPAVLGPLNTPSGVAAAIEELHNNFPRGLGVLQGAMLMNRLNAVAAGYARFVPEQPADHRPAAGA